VSELRGEKVDIVEWKEDPAEFVANAISPAKVREVIVDPENLTAEVIVPDNQLSLAIGKEGQNARLAAKLTGWRIDILSESQAMEAASIRAEQELLKEGAEEKDKICRAITSSGQRCKNKALPGSEFCGIAAHQRLAELIKKGSEEVEVFTPVEAELAPQAVSEEVELNADAEATDDAEGAGGIDQMTLGEEELIEALDTTEVETATEQQQDQPEQADLKVEAVEKDTEEE
jgi:transcription termination/antitermination protein NusA